MNVERIVLAVAGSFVVLSVALAYFTQVQLWLLLTAFVGLNLLQSAFTGFCPLAVILKKAGKESGTAF
jgi:hypothetical protein